MRISEINDQTPTMWRLSPFAALPKALRYCEAETADEAAKILGDRLAKTLWNRAKEPQAASIKLRRPPSGRLHSYTVTFTARDREGDPLEKVLDMVVRNSTDEFGSE